MISKHTYTQKNAKESWKILLNFPFQLKFCNLMFNESILKIKMDVEERMLIE